MVQKNVRKKIINSFVSCPGCGRNKKALRKLYGTRPWSMIITVDHIKPKAMGGGSNAANLVGVCYKCNTLKGDKYPWDWFGAQHLCFSTWTKKAKVKK